MAAVAADLLPAAVAEADLPTPAVVVDSAPREEEVLAAPGSVDWGVACYCLFLGSLMLGIIIFASMRLNF